MRSWSEHHNFNLNFSFSIYWSRSPLPDPVIFYSSSRRSDQDPDPGKVQPDLQPYSKPWYFYHMVVQNTIRRCGAFGKSGEFRSLVSRTAYFFLSNRYFELLNAIVFINSCVQIFFLDKPIFPISLRNISQLPSTISTIIKTTWKSFSFTFFYLFRLGSRLRYR